MYLVVCRGPAQCSWWFRGTTGRMNDARDKLILVLCTAPAAVSGEIARALLDDGLAACVNRYAVRSTYWWEGDLVEEDEDLLILKTVEHLFGALEQKILEVHPYDVPEIIAIPVAAVSDGYLRWIRQTVQAPQ
jgi:periplasmic divalent cation tolerance protein